MYYVDVCLWLWWPGAVGVPGTGVTGGCNVNKLNVPIVVMGSGHVPIGPREPLS